MILSVSRRTDIPAFFSEWFIKRLREGVVWVRNPMNYHSISEINLSPSVVDCIVFWSKNPEPIFKYLDEIDNKYKFYFQYTINAYDVDVEPFLPSLDERINNFIYLSKRYGKEKVIWRYDPVIITNKYTLEWHIEKFNYIAEKLKAYVDNCVFSFVDLYDKNRNNLLDLQIKDLNIEQMLNISKEFKKICLLNNIELKTCSEDIDLFSLGIKKSCCIDPLLISHIVNCKLNVKKDKNQREPCGCIESIDIGQYNTCKHGCVYCYANYSKKSVENNCLNHIMDSKLLLGEEEEEDVVHIRDVKSLKILQSSFWDNV